MSEPASPPDVPQWDVADRMRKALREADIGVAEMADYLDVSRTSVSNWINGRVEPSTQTLRLWALRCGVKFTWLADDAGSDRDDDLPDMFRQVSRPRRRRQSPPCCKPRHLTLVVA